MQFLEADLAVYKRLTGSPLDSQGRPALDPITRIPVNRSRLLPPDFGGGYGPSYGVRIPVMKAPHDFSHGLTSKDQGALPLFKGFALDTFRQIPVFDTNLEGRKWEDFFPSVTFRLSSFSPDRSVFLYFDTIEVDGPTHNILNRNGDIVDVGVSSRTSRPHPDSYKLQYAISIQSKSGIEHGLILAEVLRLFPQNGAIRVEYMDGATHDCDMFLVNQMTISPQDVMGIRGHEYMSVSGDEQRFYKTTLYYDIESYVDNTTTDTYTESTLIYSRILEIGTLNERLFERQELNAQDMEVV
jgi:hypothetical protein